MRSIREHLQELPEPARSQALANMWWEDAETRCADPAYALYQAFNWSRSPQGYRYWKEIFNNLQSKPKTT